jgi:hypothetical protein
LWLFFAIGAIGWTVALFARLPILDVINNLGSITLIFTIASLLAGIFEEGTRYILIHGIKYATKRFKTFEINWKHVLAFGLGWGFIEALLLYAVNIISAVYVQEYNISFFDVLPGAVERNSAVIFHVAVTFIAYKAVISRIKLKIVFVALAMTLHFAFNFIAGMLAYALGLSVWYIEIPLLAISISIALLVYLLVEKDFTLKSIDGQK